MKLLVICASGMSSSALVNKMREYIKEHPDMDYQVGSCASNQISRVVPLADLILLSPQLVYLEDEIRADYPDKKLHCISEKDYANQNIANILSALKENRETRSKGFIRIARIAKLIGRNKVLLAVSKGMMSVMPVTLLGSICTLLLNFPIDSISAWISSGWLGSILKIISSVTTGCISLFASYFIAYHYSNSLKSNGSIAGLNALIISLMVFGIENGELDLTYMGGKGIFVAILVGIFSGDIFHFISKQTKRKTLQRVPAEIREQFLALVPTIVTVLLFSICTISVRSLTDKTFPEYVYHVLQMPVNNYAGNSAVTFLSLNFMSGIFWFFGIHGGSIMGPVLNAIYSSLSVANLTAFQLNQALPYMIERHYVYCYTFGGAGSTLALAALMVFASKSAYMKNLGKVAFPMGVFFINEPILFGLPIVLNPLMLLPFLGIPLICGILSYFATMMGLIPYLNGIAIPWTTPPIISGLILGGVRLALWQIVMIVLQLFMWYPFFRIEDSKYVEIERKKG